MLSYIRKGVARRYLNLFFRKNSNQTFPAVILSFDCDFRKDIESLPSILEILKGYDIKASFACIGRWIERYPRIHQTILEQGHEVINHTYSHPNNEELNPKKFNELNFNEQKEEIGKCQEVCKTVLDYSPNGFRTPHFAALHTKEVYALLKELGLTFSSSTTSTKTGNISPFKVGGIIEIPITPCPEHIFYPFDTWHSFRAKPPNHTCEEFIGLFHYIIDLSLKYKTLVNLYFDPQDFVKERILKDLLNYISDLKIPSFTYGQYITSS